MAIVTTDDKHYKAISEAIREYVLEEQFKPSEMADKVRFACMCADSVGYNRGEMDGRTRGQEEGYGVGLVEGQLSLLQASKHLNATVSGEVVEVSDVSPVEHTVAVRLSSAAVMDFSGVKVKRHGKNLFESNADTLEMVSPEPRRYGYLILLPAGTYTVHAESLVEEFNTWVYHEARDMSGTQIGNIGENYNHPVVGSKLRTVTFTVDEDFYYVIYAAGVTTAANAEAIFKRFNIQLEVGDTATPYTPYMESTTHTANADGTVEGVRSLSPSMILTTNTNDVTINCSYLRDIDTYIDGLGGA